MKIFLSIVFIILASIAILVGFNYANKYILHKIKANKWVVLIFAIIAFFAPVVLAPYATVKFPRGLLLVPQVIFVFLLLWFMDLMGWFKRVEASAASHNGIKRVAHKAKKNDVIKPKAKPNRVKKN